MEALGERLERVGFPGYRQWMELMAEWYEESRDEAKQELESLVWIREEKKNPMARQDPQSDRSLGRISSVIVRRRSTPARGLG